MKAAIPNKNEICSWNFFSRQNFFWRVVKLETSVGEIFSWSWFSGFLQFSVALDSFECFHGSKGRAVSVRAILLALLASLILKPFGLLVPRTGKGPNFLPCLVTSLELGPFWVLDKIRQAHQVQKYLKLFVGHGYRTIFIEPEGAFSRSWPIYFWLLLYSTLIELMATGLQARAQL